MSAHEGRIEKRIRQAIPLELCTLHGQGSVERTITENVCSLGARVLTWRTMKPNERLMVRLIELNQRIQARVVYCQRLPDGRFGVGLQFQGMSSWLTKHLGGTDESLRLPGGRI